MKTAVEWLEDEVDRIVETYDVDMMRCYLEEAYEKAKEMEKEKIKEMEFLKFQRDVYIKDIEILKARLREAEQNKN
jgi:N-methylhydantoinase B/oxoprolinase/acetone carboxylase alpha subunit